MDASTREFFIAQMVSDGIDPDSVAAREFLARQEAEEGLPCPICQDPDCDLDCDGDYGWDDEDEQ